MVAKTRATTELNSLRKAAEVSIRPYLCFSPSASPAGRLGFAPEVVAGIIGGQGNMGSSLSVLEVASIRFRNGKSENDPALRRGLELKLS